MPSPLSHRATLPGLPAACRRRGTLAAMPRLARALTYLWALPTTCIGLLLAAAAVVTGGRARIVEGVLEAHGGAAAWVLRRVGASAMTLGHVVIAVDQQAHERCRGHERIHVRQCERWGPLFLPAYGLASLVARLRGGGWYRDNRFEQEARGEQRMKDEG